MDGIEGKHIIPFVGGLTELLKGFAITDLSRDKMILKDALLMEYDVNLIIGLVGDVQGNVGLSMRSETAFNLVSAMMGGQEIAELDSLARSALGEFANMFAAGAATQFQGLDKFMDITPPTTIVGSELKMYISMVQTVSIDMESSVGGIQLNVGLENVN